VREILRVARDRDADVAAWFEVIDQFDHAVAARSSLEELVRLAGDITGVSAGVRDEWSRVRVEATDGLLAVDDTVGIDVARLAAAQRLRGRTAAPLETERGAALVSSIELASGRAGLAWLLGPTGRRWEPTDHLVVERLAGAVAARVLDARKRRGGAGAFDPAAIERLLSGPLSEDALAQAARHARLSPSDRYVAVALDQDPANAIDLEALAALAEKGIAECGLGARGAVIGSCAAVVARAGEALGEALQELARSEPRLGVAIRVGVGEPAGLEELWRSWRHAREALALRTMVADGDEPAQFDQLGALHLLAQIPTAAVHTSPLIAALGDPVCHTGSPTDVEVLTAYLEEGTLRRAGERVFLHHTSVQHRVKSIESRLGLDLRDPRTRFRVQLALRLMAIDEALGAPGSLRA
jgi:hypothetical protein